MDSTIPRVPTSGLATGVTRAEQGSLLGVGEPEGGTSPSLFASLLGGVDEACGSSSEGEPAEPPAGPADSVDTTAKADRNVLWQQMFPLFVQLPPAEAPAKLGLGGGEAETAAPDTAAELAAEGENGGSGAAGSDFAQGDFVPRPSTRAWRLDPSGSEPFLPLATDPLDHAAAETGVLPGLPPALVDEPERGSAQTLAERVPMRGASPSLNDLALPRESAPLFSPPPTPPWRAGERDSPLPLPRGAAGESRDEAADGFQFRQNLGVETAALPLIRMDATELEEKPALEAEDARLRMAFAAVDGDVKAARTIQAATSARAPLVQSEVPRLDGGSEQRRAFFAARAGASQVALDRPIEPAVSNSLNPELEGVANDQSPVGTRVAKLVPDVTRATPVHWAATFLSPGESLVQPGSPARGDVFPEAAAEAASAGRAVQAATKVIESMAGSEQRVASSVVLRFKIGSDDLAVRIGMIDGQPTAEFHTRSAEVRAAVLREWQASIPADSPLRVREPVFAAGFSADAREGQPRQQEGRSSGRPQREESGALPLAASPRASREQSGRVRAETVTPSSGILSVFA